MRQSFEPRKVNSNAWLSWCSEAVLLSVRQPLRNTLIALFFCLPYLVLPGTDNIWLFVLFLVYALVCPPVIFSTMVIASYCSDYSKPLLPRLISVRQLFGVLKTIACYALIMMSVALLGSLIFLSLLTIGLPHPPSEWAPVQVAHTLKPAFLSFQPGEKLWWSLAIYLFFGAATWFIAPLMCIAHCPFFIGIRLAYRTLVKNPFMFWLPLLIAVTLVPLCWLSGIFAIPAVIIISMLVYCSFRDIFMDRQHSFPVTAAGHAKTMVSQH